MGVWARIVPSRASFKKMIEKWKVKKGIKYSRQSSKRSSAIKSPRFSQERKLFNTIGTALSDLIEAFKESIGGIHNELHTKITKDFMTNVSNINLKDTMAKVQASLKDMSFGWPLYSSKDLAIKREKLPPTIRSPEMNLIQAGTSKCAENHNSVFKSCPKYVGDVYKFLEGSAYMSLFSMSGNLEILKLPDIPFQVVDK